MRSLFLALLTGLLVPTIPGILSATSPPEGPVVLQVSGLAGPAPQVDFDMAFLQTLPSAGFETETIWTDGVQTFEGVELYSLLKHLTVDAGTLHVVAANDYAIDIPVVEVAPGGALIAYLQNGQPMSVRDRGPLWIVYPYDSDPAFRTELIYSRSIWQLTRIELRP